MPRERLPMRKIYDVLRLHAGGLPKRRIAVSLNIGRTTVGDYINRARRAGLGWPLPENMSDEDLERLLFPPPAAISPDRRPPPDWPVLHRELKRPGVTLSLLWEEYRAVYRDGYGCSRFCDLYRAWKGKLDLTMRQTHLAGEKMFVDYAGATIDAANAYADEFRADYNGRFGKEPLNPKDMHRPLSELDSLDDAMCHKEQRTLSGSLTLRYDKILFIVEPSELATSLAKKRVTVCDYPDGRLEIRHGDVSLPYGTFDKLQSVNRAEIVENKRLGTALKFFPSDIYYHTGS